MRERNTPNAIRDSLISHITFFCEQPYLDEFKKEIEISLANCINQNGYQCTHIPTLLAVLKVEIDALMDKVHKQQGKTYKLFYSEFQRLIQKNINIPGSYIETHMDASPPIDLGNNIFNNPLLITTQNLFKNEQKVVDAVKTLENIDSTEEYCEKLAVLLLELIQIRTHKTLNTHLKNITDVNQQEYSCFVFANQLIFDLQKGNMDRDAAKQQAIKLITQLQIFYDRSE